MHEPDKPLLPGVDWLDWQANDVFRSSSLLVKFSTEPPTRRAREPDDKGIFDMNVATITYESFQPNLTKILCRCQDDNHPPVQRLFDEGGGYSIDTA
jgi:hypothetical protein